MWIEVVDGLRWGFTNFIPMVPVTLFSIDVYGLICYFDLVPMLTYVYVKFTFAYKIYLTM